MKYYEKLDVLHNRWGLAYNMLSMASLSCVRGQEDYLEFSITRRNMKKEKKLVILIFKKKMIFKGFFLLFMASVQSRKHDSPLVPGVLL